MRRFCIIFLYPIILLGCIGQSHKNVPVVTPTSIITETVVAPVSSFTATPVSVAPSVTPTKISTPTSNFQNIPQIIFTPAPQALCPPSSTSKIVMPTEIPLNENSSLKIPLSDASILEILNSGGIEQLVLRLSSPNDINFRYEDLTNDGARELIIRNWYEEYLVVFGCQNGKYVNLLTVEKGFEMTPAIITIQDLNHNGVKELAVNIMTCHYCTGIKVYEWNGLGFDSLVKAWIIGYASGKLEFSDVAELAGNTLASVDDTDNNGTFELILDGGVPSYLAGMIGMDGPWRKEKVIYMWNGENYVWYSQDYYPPNFRFEAIQDGDTETIRGDYDSALKSYQAAIFDDKLKSWTREVWREISQNQDPQFLSYPDVEKMPFNQDEYNQLSAYARYRIMIIYLKQGWDDDANTVYQTLIEEYPQGNVGYLYTELATEFWKEFQASHEISSACNKVVIYATNHSEILEPLGSHGLFDKSYEPEDICPFK